MEKVQAVSIVKRLAAYYPNWKVDKNIIEIWVDTLINEDYENAMQNMKEYISSNEYPPSIAAIIKPNSRIEGKRDIERTRQMLKEQDEISKSISRELPWVRDGMSREEWARKIIAEKEGHKWDTSA
jgi:ferritin